MKLEQIDPNQKREARFIRGVLIGCIIAVILVVGGCVTLLIVGVRSIAKLGEQTYEPPPQVEIASHFEHPEVIRLFLGLASPEEAATIPQGLYRITEGEINAYLDKRLKDSSALETARAKIESGSLLLYYSFAWIREETAKGETRRKERWTFFSPDIKVSYSATFRTTVENGRVHLELISLKVGKLSDRRRAGESPEAIRNSDPEKSPPAIRRLLGIPGTEGQRLLNTIFEGLSYGSEVASVKLKPLEALIEVAPGQSVSSL